MDSQIPGTHPNTTLPLPPLGGAGVPQPSAESKAALEAKWAALKDAPPSLADLIILVNAHPEWLDWAKASKAGTFQFNPH